VTRSLDRCPGEEFLSAQPVATPEVAIDFLRALSNNGIEVQTYQGDMRDFLLGHNLNVVRTASVDAAVSVFSSGVADFV
jgi:hypothetical protein